jgi:4-hydroxy-tetrahydrodipicolinate reductase
MNIAIHGARGRMGQRLQALLSAEADMTVVRLIEADGHPDVGNAFDGVAVTSDKTDLAGVDMVIDFSLPDGSMEMLSACRQAKIPVIVATTGLETEQVEQVNSAASDIPVVYSPNMSIGVNLLFKVIDEVASILKGYEVTVVEAHHVHKKDAPSGTAKKMVDLVNNKGFDIEYDDVKAVRKGEIVGDHRIVFDGPTDSFEISHHAKTRDMFATGAIAAARWLYGKPAGLYSMQKVLGLE